MLKKRVFFAVIVFIILAGFSPLFAEGGDFMHVLQTEVASYKTFVVINEVRVPGQYKGILNKTLMEKLTEIRNYRNIGSIDLNETRKLDVSSGLKNVSFESSRMILVNAEYRIIEIRRNVGEIDGGQYLIEKIRQPKLFISIVLYDISGKKILAETKKTFDLKTDIAGVFCGKIRDEIAIYYPDVYAVVYECGLYITPQISFPQGKLTHIVSDIYGVDIGVQIRRIFTNWASFSLQTGFAYGFSDNRMIQHYFSIPLVLSFGRFFSPWEWLKITPMIGAGYISHYVVSDSEIDIYFDPVVNLGLSIEFWLNDDYAVYTKCSGTFIFEERHRGEYISIGLGLLWRFTL